MSLFSKEKPVRVKRKIAKQYHVLELKESLITSKEGEYLRNISFGVKRLKDILGGRPTQESKNEAIKLAKIIVDKLANAEKISKRIEKLAISSERTAKKLVAAGRKAALNKKLYAATKNTFKIMKAQHKIAKDILNKIKKMPPAELKKLQQEVDILYAHIDRIYRYVAYYLSEEIAGLQIEFERHRKS